jgi:cob(I)alamin adenosyltransferase
MAEEKKRLERGYVQVYTGNGKGKTTAALGLALRAAGAGLKVFIGQFTKGREAGEHAALARLSETIVVERFGEAGFMRGRPQEKDVRAARAGLDRIRRIVASGGCDVAVLDEANIATRYGLIEVEDLLDLIDRKPDHVELVITGRGADPRIIEAAHLVTEMVDVKHYFKQGKVRARRGIEF